MSRIVRAFEAQRDFLAVQGLDNEFETEREFVVRREPLRLQLDSVPLPGGHRKRFPLDLGADAWTDGHVVVEDGRILGFIATCLEPWNSRLTIRHFYVDRHHRRRGIGRALIKHAVEAGRAAGAVTAWVETSNRNYPGVLAYGRLGFVLCGFDLSLYQGTPAQGEFALYLARDLRDHGLG